jgi:NADH-ubiquinone oxidoreductase chain 6
MNNLFLIPINYSNGLQIEILDLISFIAILSGILVVTNKNPIISVLFLIGLFLSISAYLLLIGLNFIGFAYLLVYIGAISILFLFILMLINIRISELISNSKNSIPLALFIGIITYFIFYQVLYTNTQHSAEYPLGNNINKVNYVSSNT